MFTPGVAVALIVASKVRLVLCPPLRNPPMALVAFVPKSKVMVDPETKAWSPSRASVLAPALAPPVMTKLLVK